MRMMLLTLIPVLFTTVGSAHTLEGQYQRAIQSVLQNLKENGAVVASPSQHEPNYYYDWVRDTSLTLRALSAIAEDPTTPPLTQKILNDKIDLWIEWERHRQLNTELTGLGEPRYHLDGRVNLDPWGRPQNDGPAIRALTAIGIANRWIKEGRLRDINAKLYAPTLPAETLIKRDLEYVAHHWTEESFDLWEEERGLHFYTLTSQKVALQKGAALAKILSDPKAALFYEAEANRIQDLLNRFYEPDTGTLRYAIQRSPGLPHKKSHLDIAVILASIQTFDGAFQVPAPAALATLNALMASFQDHYKINQTLTRSRGQVLGVALGRYPDDLYDGAGFGGGNPWFLSTLAAAEFFCDLKKSSARYPKETLNQLALAQFNRVFYHLNADGSMSEQFDREQGFERGARDLTWSYVSWITAYRACFR